jgi:uncharacterized membrane protein
MWGKERLIQRAAKFRWKKVTIFITKMLIVINMVVVVVVLLMIMMMISVGCDEWHMVFNTAARK